MRIPSGKTDQLIYFVAVDSTDLKTRKTGLTSFTVYRSRNGGAATAYTTPTVTELSAANMPGVYALTVDEDTTIASTSDSEEYCVHITQASMAPVTRTIELYRRTTTTGETIAASSGAVSTVTTVNGLAANTITAASMAADAGTEIAAAVWDELLAGHVVAASMGETMNYLAGSDFPSETTIAGAVWDEAVAGHNVPGTFGDVVQSAAQTDDIPTAAENAAAVWDMDATAHQTNGTFGQAIGDAAGNSSIFQYVSGIPDDIFDAPDAVETGLTLRQWLRLMAAANLGKVSGFSTGSPVYRDVNDTKNRITATTTADGRSAVTFDAA